jgi:hypothetical protein
VVRFPEPRIERRRKKRAVDAAKAEQRAADKLARKMAAIEPRSGNDRRQAERRTEALTGKALDDRLAELGITGDRRQGQRRTGDRRQR